MKTPSKKPRKQTRKVVQDFPVPAGLHAVYRSGDPKEPEYSSPVIALMAIEEAEEGGEKRFVLDWFDAIPGSIESTGSDPSFIRFEIIDPMEPTKKAISEGFERLEKAIRSGFHGDELLGVGSPLQEGFKGLKESLDGIAESIFDAGGD